MQNISLNTANRRVYEVARIVKPFPVDANWDKEPWQSIHPLTVNQPMGPRPEHFPEVMAKLAYDREAIYVIFRVKDKYVRAVAGNYQGKVYEDSCVEFFFTSGTDVSAGYFNLEMNCGGQALFHHQKVPRKDPVSISPDDFSGVEIAHTMPEIVEPEIKKPVTWFVEYRIPYSILEHYAAVVRPSPGAQWKANFYKCADKTSHPHWLTWSAVDLPEPDFHQPDFFGTLKFR